MHVFDGINWISIFENPYISQFPSPGHMREAEWEGSSRSDCLILGQPSSFWAHAFDLAGCHLGSIWLNPSLVHNGANPIELHLKKWLTLANPKLNFWQNWKQGEFMVVKKVQVILFLWWTVRKPRCCTTKRIRCRELPSGYLLKFPHKLAKKKSKNILFLRERSAKSPQRKKSHGNGVGGLIKWDCSSGPQALSWLHLLEIFVRVLISFGKLQIRMTFVGHRKNKENGERGSEPRSWNATTMSSDSSLG